MTDAELADLFRAQRDRAEAQRDAYLILIKKLSQQLASLQSPSTTQPTPPIHPPLSKDLRVPVSRERTPPTPATPADW